MTSLPSVLTFEDKCPQSPEELAIERDKYVNWADTYQNPLTEGFKSFKSVPTSKLILFHVALKHNLSLRGLAQDPNQTSSGDIIIPGADLKVDADFSYKLSQQVDLTTPYYNDYITFSIKAPEYQINADGFVDVFSPEVWLWLWLSAAICTGVIYAVSFSFITRKFELNFRQSLAFILKNLIDEGHKLKEPKAAVQVFASVWTVVAFLTSTAYVSVVVSSVLSLDPPSPPPETFEDVVKAGMKPLTANTEHQNVMNYLKGSESATFKHLAGKMSKVKYLINCQDAAVRDASTACVAKFRGMQSFLESKYTDKNGSPSLLISKYRGSVIWIGYAVRKKSQFEGILSNFISRTTAAGLVDHWTSIADHGRRRMGVALGPGDLCSNKPHLYDLWIKLGNEANKNNTNKHIQGCFRWDVRDFEDIVKKHCVKLDQTDTSSLDSMLKVEHLIIVVQAMLIWDSLAFVCFILELGYVKLCTRFQKLRLQPGLSCGMSVLVVKPMEPVNEPVLPSLYYW